MKTKAFTTAAAVALALGTAPMAAADVNDLGFYAGVRALPAFNAEAEGEALSGGPGGTFRQDSGSFRPSIGGGAMVGYHWNRHGAPIRTELEFAYRYRIDFDTVASGPPRVGYKDDVGNTSLMLNLFFDIDLGATWRPYVGIGLGWSRNMSVTVRGDSSAGVFEEIENNTDDFAYSGMVGFRIAISPRWVGDLGYRFIDLGDIDTGTFSTGDRVTADHYRAHEILIGLVYMF